MRETYFRYAQEDTLTKEHRVLLSRLIENMFLRDAAMAFPEVLDALGSNWPEVRYVAAYWVGYYYVGDVLLFDDEPWLNRVWPPYVKEQRGQVESELSALSFDSCYDVRVRALRSLVRLRPLRSNEVESLCEVVAGRDLNRSNTCVTFLSEPFLSCRKEAVEVLLSIVEFDRYRAEVLECLTSVLDEQEGASDPIIEKLRERLRPSTVPGQSSGDCGNTVASGVYFYCLVAGDFRATKKMVLIR